MAYDAERGQMVLFAGGRSYPGLCNDTWLLSLATAAAPRFSVQGVVNAASYVGGPVAPGEIITIFGSDLGPSSPASLQLTPDGKYVTKVLANTRVLFDGVPAPLLYVSATQVSAVAPFSLAGKSVTRVQVEYMGRSSEAVTLPVVAAAPGIFTVGATGKGQGAVLYWPDYKLNGAGNPARPGMTVMVFGTGGGLLQPPGEDGEIVSRVQRLELPVTASIGGVPAVVSYAGSAPGLVAGVLQVNVVVPEGVPEGDAVPLVVKVGEMESQPGVTMVVRSETAPPQ
jgi:uncharacterized protein (TIGR03437 family)